MLISANFLNALEVRSCERISSHGLFKWGLRWVYPGSTRVSPHGFGMHLDSDHTRPGSDSSGVRVKPSDLFYVGGAPVGIFYQDKSLGMDVRNQHFDDV